MEQNREPRNEPIHLWSTDLRQDCQEYTIKPRNDFGETLYPLQEKWNWTLYSHHIQKVNSKWIKDLNIRSKTIKLLEDNIGKKLFGTGFGNEFLFDMARKAKIDKWDCIKLKSSGTSLVAQWLRIRLPIQGTRVWALVWEDPTCRGATRPVHHNYWACALEPVCHNYWSPRT